MITTKRCILIAEKCEFLERFEATEFADISEIQNVWKRNKTPIVSDKLVANKLAGYNVLNVPEEIIGNVEAFTDFCHENGFECGEFISGITYDTAQERCFMCELARHVEWVIWFGTISMLKKLWTVSFMRRKIST